MKAKQLPDGLDEWLKTRTIVIGGTRWLAASGDRDTRRANERKPNRSSFAKAIRVLIRINLVPLSQIRPARAGLFCEAKESLTRA
jgi:hypothetical protein